MLDTLKRFRCPGTRGFHPRRIRPEQFVFAYQASTGLASALFLRVTVPRTCGTYLELRVSGERLVLGLSPCAAQRSRSRVPEEIIIYGDCSMFRARAKYGRNSIIAVNGTRPSNAFENAGNPRVTRSLGLQECRATRVPVARCEELIRKKGPKKTMPF